MVDESERGIGKTAYVGLAFGQVAVALLDHLQPPVR